MWEFSQITSENFLYILLQNCIFVKYYILIILSQREFFEEGGCTMTTADLIWKLIEIILNDKSKDDDQETNG